MTITFRDNTPVIELIAGTPHERLLPLRSLLVGVGETAI
jgi:hypothetical protein